MTKSTVRGRPADPAKQRLQKEKLIKAAEALLSLKSYRDITIRELATQAEVNSAMVSYYFGNKEGLFIALLDVLSEKHFVNMRKIALEKEPIRRFVETMIKMLSANNSIARLVHDEMAPENSKLGRAFIERFPKRMASFLPNLIKMNTPIKDDQKAKYAAFSLVSMIITPFVGKGVRELAWNISDDELRSEEWASHVYSQFISGCGTAFDDNNKVQGG